MAQKRGVVPPVYLLLATIAMFLLNNRWPVVRFGSTPLKVAGTAIMILGVGITFASAGLFSKLGTPVRPFDKPTRVVTTGMFRSTRNPMYLGMVVALLGVAGILGSISVFLPILAFVAIIHYWFILREERFMEDLFGDEYRAYKNKVRRWF